MERGSSLNRFAALCFEGRGESKPWTEHDFRISIVFKKALISPTGRSCFSQVGTHAHHKASEDTEESSTTTSLSALHRVLLLNLPFSLPPPPLPPLPPPASPSPFRQLKAIPPPRHHLLVLIQVEPA
eukprot:756023-Hanusia_phi.AAC.6